MIKTKNNVLLFLLIGLSAIMMACGIVSFKLISVNADEITSVNITVDYGPYGTRIPKGAKGKQYQVFDATAVDNLGNEVFVDYQVYDPEGKVLSVVDGKFNTEDSGKYVISYKATAGVVQGIVDVKVTVVDSCEPLTYDINENIVDSSYTGEIVYFYEGDANGGLGEIDVNVSLLYNEELISLVDAGDYKYFIPNKSGEYTLEFNLIDYVGNEYKTSKVITVSDLLEPIMQTPSIARVNKLNEKVVLPYVDAVLYRNGEVYYVPVKVYYDSTEITSSMTYQALTGNHTIKYVAENVFDTSKKTEYSIAVQTLEYTDAYFRNYFALDNFTGEFIEGSNGYILSNIEKGDAGFQFKSKIYKEFVNIGFEIYGDSYNFKSVEVTLSDSYKANDSVTLSFVNKRVMNIFHNENLYYKATNGKTLYDVMQEGLYIGYDEQTHSILDVNGNVYAVIKNFDDGRLFTGFASDYVYISCKFLDMDSTKIAVTKIAMSSVNSAADDKVAPVFCGLNSFIGTLSSNIGETIEVKTPRAFDVLNNENITYRMEINYSDSQDKNNNKSIFKGNVTKYDLTLDRIGDYLVYFYANDGKKDQRLVMTIHVFDNVAPNVNVEWEKSTVVVGETISLPKANVVDNYSTNENCMVILHVTYGDYFRDIVKSDTYTFEKAGTYLFTYSVWDQTGNYTIVRYSVECKEK